MNNPLDEFGAKIRAEREARGLTQKQLAEKLGMSHRTVMQAEICRSNPKMETVILLAKELNISLDALVFPETATPNAVPKCVYALRKELIPTAVKQVCRTDAERVRFNTGASVRHRVHLSCQAAAGTVPVLIHEVTGICRNETGAFAHN